MQNRKNGFTLLEILVAVLIIGVLAAIAVPHYQRAMNRSAGAGVIASLKPVVDAANKSFLEYGTYSGMNWSDLDGATSAQFTASGKTWDFGVEGEDHCAVVFGESTGGVPGLFYTLQDGHVVAVSCNSLEPTAEKECREYFGTLPNLQPYCSGNVCCSWNEDSLESGNSDNYSRPYTSPDPYSSDSRPHYPNVPYSRPWGILAEYAKPIKDSQGNFVGYIQMSIPGTPVYDSYGYFMYYSWPPGTPPAYDSYHS